ncbi:Hypothetical protein PHPALM_36180 [Phytophthora palmivora]|uniref:RxLR effector protein n=1 Tax=Phytophthora palmivora TaxID=4796 RepID=A0A2P4X0M6_9STRA|nr:Hypothetical protein PHPALM_36180 [Phytophthora palmivora]
MRFSYLLVSAAILAAAHETVSAVITSDNTEISQEATPDMVESKRLLRSHEESEEERAINWAAYDAKWMPRVKQWVDDGKLPSKLKAFYEKKSSRGLDGLRKRKYDLMNAAFLKKFPNGVNADGLK